MKKLILPLIVIAASGAYVWSQQAHIAAENAMSINAPSLDAGKLDASTAPANPPADASPAPAATSALPTAETPPLTTSPAVKSSQLSPVKPLLPTPAEVTPATVEVTPRPAPVQPAAEQPAAVLPVRPTALPAPSQAAVPATTVNMPLPMARPARGVSSRPQIMLAASTVQVAQASGHYRDGSYRGSVADAYYGEVQVQANVQNGRLASVKILRYPNDRRTSRYINSQALPILQQEAIEAQSAKVDFVSGATLSSNAYAQSLTSALAQAGS